MILALFRMKIYDYEMKVLEILIAIISSYNTSITILIQITLYLFYGFIYTLHKTK